MSSPGDHLALPRGFRDILPTEARELRAIERSLGTSFERYGYVPLEPPSVEFARAAATVDERRMIRFLDQGNLLALRPDVTTAIARVVAQRYRDARAALRLSYFTPVFRQDRLMRGSEREYDQAGVELIGPTGAAADAEVLALLCESLTSLGMRHALSPGDAQAGTFTIEVGHMGAVRALFAGIPYDASEVVLGRLREADHVAAFRVAAEAGLPGDRIERARRALAARGRGIEEVDAPEATELREAIHLARDLFPGVGSWGVPDLAVIPALPYYSGVVFEVVSPGVGAPIAMGGRYDGLLARYGADRAATGFAINVPLLHQALVGAGWKPPEDLPLISLEGGEERDRFRVAGELRREGLDVVLGPVVETAGRELVTVKVVGPAMVERGGTRIALQDLVAILRRASPQGSRAGPRQIDVGRRHFDVDVQGAPKEREGR